MSYYMGDFYRGDPGIGSFFKGLASTVAGFIPGVGPLISKGISALPGGAKPVAGAISAVAGSAIQRVGTAIVKHPVLSAAGAAGAGLAMGAAGEAMMGARGAHKGRVLKKCGMVLKSGKIGKCHRRMNPFNPHAARRSARRLHSLVRHYRKYVGFVSAKRPKGRPYFKAKKRRA